MARQYAQRMRSGTSASWSKKSRAFSRATQGSNLLVIVLLAVLLAERQSLKDAYRRKETF
jgi:hypothetical protein